MAEKILYDPFYGVKMVFHLAVSKSLNMLSHSPPPNIYIIFPHLNDSEDVIPSTLLMLNSQVKFLSSDLT